MSEKAALTIVGGILAVIFLLALGAVRSSWTERETIGVQAEKEAIERVDNKKSDKQITQNSGENASPAKRDGEAKKEEADENTTEFGPAIFGYRFKVTDGLLVLFTGFLAWSTWGLQRSTVGLQIAADEQAKLTNRLFEVDQRPWIRVNLQIADPNPIFREDGSIDIKFHVSVKNIGKSPAFQAANGWLVYIGYDGFEEAFQGMRSFTEDQSYSKVLTIFPGDTDDWGNTENIRASQIEASNRIEGKGMGSAMQFIIVSYQYKSGFSDIPLETVRMYKFGIGFFEGPLPIRSSDAVDKTVQIKLWKELIT